MKTISSEQSEPMGTSIPDVCFKLDRKNLWVFSLSFLFFGVVSGLSWIIHLGYWPVADWTKHGLMFALFWTAWVVFSICGLVSVWKSRLYLTRDGVEKVGCFRTKSVYWKDLTKVRWRKFPVQGSVVLLARPCRIVVEFASFNRADQLAIIDYIRARSDPLIQEQWDAFSTRWPKSPAPKKPLPRWYRIALGIFTLNLGIMSCVVWAVNGQIQHLAKSILYMACATFFFIMTWKAQHKPSNE